PRMALFMAASRCSDHEFLWLRDRIAPRQLLLGVNDHRIHCVPRSSIASQRRVCGGRVGSGQDGVEAASSCSVSPRGRSHAKRASMNIRRLALRLHATLSTLLEGPGEIIWYAHAGIGLVMAASLLLWGASVAVALAAAVTSFV